MKIINVFVFWILLCGVESLALAKGSICNPDQSIAQQKTKVIAQDAKALLLKVMQDKALFMWPVQVCKCWLSSLYGPRRSGFHNGIDLAARKGTLVYAAADGFVEVAQQSADPAGYGNMILLDHKKLGYKTRYAHLDDLAVQEGDFVQQGQKIGTVGATGHVIAKTSTSDPSHLHFEVYRADKRINPLIVLFAADPAWVKNQL